MVSVEFDSIMLARLIGVVDCNVLAGICRKLQSCDRNCARHESSVDPKVPVYAAGKLAGGVNRYFGIHRRLVTSTVPITALQLTADTGENITIDYTDQSGKHYTVKLNANHQLLP